MKYTAALTGNPNCGKTTLFNALTGSNQYVGNWPGVTVEKREARFLLEEDEIALTDLPGVYSLSPYSLEERITSGFLTSEMPDVVIDIADACSLERNLFLTMQIIDTGRPTVLALNMMDELRARGGNIDCSKLSKALGARVVGISAKRSEGFDELFAAIRDTLKEEHTVPFRGKQPNGKESENAKYTRIDEALSASMYSAGTERGYEPDRILLGKGAYIAFFAMLAAMFAVTFGPIGSSLSGAAGTCVDAFIRVPAESLLQALHSPQWVRSLTLSGVIGGVGGVITFLPQILLLFAFLSILEDSGYMARAAFLTDRLLHGLGLSGRSFIPLLMGFGCTTTAVLGARTVENEHDRRMTTLLTPMMSCGAKLPVYALVCSAVFPGREAAVVLGLYALGMAMLLPAGLLLKRFVFRETDTPFLMELPPYRIPTAKGVALRLRDRAKEFLTRAGTVLFAVSVLIWAMQQVTPTFRIAQSEADSLFGQIGAALTPLLRPLGLGDWRCGVSLLSGLIAKEATLSTMQTVYQTTDSAALSAYLATQWSPAQALPFLVFMLLYPPCVSALTVLRRELGGWRWAGASFLLQTALAWLTALATRLICIWRF